MDGINPLISGHSPAQNFKQKDKKSVEKKKAVGFQSVLGTGAADEKSELHGLEGIPGIQSEAVLEGWIDEIFQKGEILKKDSTLNSLGAYKESVKRFISYVVSQGYEVQRSKGILNPRTFKQKEFVNVEVIEKKLDNLAAYVLSAQKEQMEILRRVDEINGMLVNLIG